ncbi:MAG: hypothetical protein AAF281_04495 [Pseudomonadota bacterium]
MNGVAVLLMAGLAGSAAAAQERVFDGTVIEVCAKADIGGPACDPAALAESLGLLSAGQVRPFAELGMESFAMLTALRYAASALFFLSEGEGCFAEEERTAAIDIWSIWVRLPGDAPGALAEEFAVYDGIMDKVVGLEMAC